MRWEEMLLGLFEDLEQQAEGLHLMERDAEIADRSRGEYAAQVDFVSRIHASTGAAVIFEVVGVGMLSGRLISVGSDWCLIEGEPSQEWLVRFSSVSEARGLSSRAIGGPSRPVAARLGLGSALRRVADARQQVVLHRSGAPTLRGWVGRVGADFLELRVGEEDLPGGAREISLVPFRHVAAVRKV